LQALIIYLFKKNTHPNRCGVVFHSSFNLHFPNK
jgi:hypothetical protein